MSVDAIQSLAERPMSIYEVHLDSWMRVPEEGNRPLRYSEVAPKLAGHVRRMGFTHVQIHAPDYGDPGELRSLIKFLREQGVGVILEADLAVKDTKVSGANELLADGQFTDGRLVMKDRSYQWDSRWADDICVFFALEPSERPRGHGKVVGWDKHAFAASYILPLSHHLVTRPRPSLLNQMPGDAWNKFANLRLLFGCVYLFPAKKLVFMGNEFGQENGWRPETSLDWHLVDDANFHGKLLNWVAHLNQFYTGEPALHQTDSNAAGFQWLDASDAASNIISFLRKSGDGKDTALVVMNFAPEPKHNYRVGVPEGGYWTEWLNSDAVEFGGSGHGNLGGVEAAPFGWNFQSHSLQLTVPPLGVVVLKSP